MKYIKMKWNHFVHWWGRLNKKGKILIGGAAVVVVYLIITNV